MDATPADMAARVDRLLAAARATIDEVPFFWVVTAAADGGANARLVNAQPTRPEEDYWTRWFLTPRIGRKADEIRRTGRATLAYQHASGEAFVTLIGRAELIDDREEVAARFHSSQFNDPEGKVASGLFAARVITQSIELHVRGVTAEPWGRGRTTLERRPDGNWRLLPVIYNAPLP